MRNRTGSRGRVAKARPKSRARPSPKLTRRERTYLIRDERQAVQKYAKLGFTSLARDEAGHARFIARQPVRSRRR